MSPLADAVDKGRKRQPWAPLAVAAIAVAALAYLVLSGMRGTVSYSLTLAEMQAMGPAAAGKGMRISGTLDGSSVSWDGESSVLRFHIREGERALPVLYRGPQPEMFRDGAEVIVEGRLGADGIFQATTLQLKCPSKYESGAPAQRGVSRIIC